MNYHRDKDYIENERLFKNIFTTRLNLLKTYLPKNINAKVLDIGCSNGVFLDLFKGLGWETWGVEPSGSGRVAKKKGHKVLLETFESSVLPKNYFDLVIMNHTLEHLENPDYVVKKIYGLLKKGGILLVDVPNAGGLGSKLMGKRWPYRLPDEHVSQFTRSSLTKVFDDAGLSVLKFKSRSGIFEYARVAEELKRKRFIIDIVTFPYAALTTALNMGDSMSLIGKKV